MFKPIEVEDDFFQLKPMNCPFHCLLFKDTPKSYRELPLRYAELGTVYRYERSGTLHGLFRVRGFTQDDAHIFCLDDQLEEEIVKVLNLVEQVLTKFGFSKYDVMLSTRPMESVGSDEIWDKATVSLKNALERKGWPFKVDEGGGAFYGPKIDVKIKDAIGRKWQCSTVQCDFNLPERFNLEYTTKDNNKRRPIMVHRAIFGSLERFVGVLVESTAGDFPFWLAPIQVKLLPVVDDAIDYCHQIKTQAEALGLRVEIDTSGNRISKQIRDAEKSKIPVVGVVGLEEMKQQSISLRLRKYGDIGQFEIGRAINGLSNFSSEGLQLTKDVLINNIISDR
jgi:threonyl-tRNA synthetase